MTNILLARYPEIDYALVARVDIRDSVEAKEFVAVWLPDYSRPIVSWAQGHYFKKIDDAIAYINQKLEGAGYGQKREKPED